VPLLATPTLMGPGSEAGTTMGYAFSFSRHDFVRGLPIHRPFKNKGRTRPSREGAGKTGCALHPRSHVQMCIKKCAHEHTGSAETLRPSLRNGFTTYFALSLAAMLCHHRPREALASQELDASIGASGPHDFAVRAGTTRQPCRPRPPHPAPRFVTIASRPFCRGGTAGACKDDLPDGRNGIFLRGGLD
jgi:hypothetical protein